MWMGGHVPLGYVLKDRKLLVHEPDAATVRTVFEGFAKLGSATKVAEELRRAGVVTRNGMPANKGFLYKLLTNRVYIGEAVHKGQPYPGEHEAIISRALWDRVHAILGESPRSRASGNRSQTPALLKGILFGPTGEAMSPTHTRKGGRLYRYYVSQAVLKRGSDACAIGRLPAAEIEGVVVAQVRKLLVSPEIIVATWREARKQSAEITETEVRDALHAFEPLWDELFPAEQARIVRLLVERVEVGTEGVELRLRIDGLTGLIRDLRQQGRAVLEQAA